MKSCIIILVCALAGLSLAGGVADGWGAGAATPLKPGKIFYRDSLKNGLDSYKIELKNGAEGKVEAVKNGIKISKTNSAGEIIVIHKDGIKAAAGTELQFSANVRTRNARPEYSLGMLRLVNHKRDFSYYRALDGRGGGGPRMQFLFNTDGSNHERKLAHYRVAAGDDAVYPAIIVAGAPSTSIWSDLCIEDFMEAKAEWRKTYIPSDRKNYDQDMIDREKFQEIIAQSPDHTATVRKDGNYATLYIDGKPVAPVFFKSHEGNSTGNPHGGKLFGEAGVDLQVVTVRFGDTKSRAGIWRSNDDFDADSGVETVRDAMRTSPDAKFVLTLILNPYIDFGREYPDETWKLHDGRVAYGHHVHIPYKVEPEIPSRYWPWISCHSLVWRKMVKQRTTELIEALKKAGLAKKIVGVHLGGGHDSQFATRHFDYSKPAADGFRRWLKEQYGSVEKLQTAWNRRDITFENAPLPVYDTKGDIFDPAAGQDKIDFFHYQKIAPFRMQEDIGAHIKKCFAKDIVMMRWCMAPFDGSLTGSYDIGEFLNSEVFEILIGQSSYARRTPGSAHAVRLPLSSFHLHNKIYLQEQDLRTWNASANETELRSIGLSLAHNFPTWQSISRKLVGQMIAERMGYWYLDLAPGWFDSDDIVGDIREMTAIHRQFVQPPVSEWGPDTALVIDEDSFFLRNLPGHYYMYDVIHAVSEQIQVLAGSAVPFDVLALNDLVRKPESALKYKTLVWIGLYNIDDARSRLLDSLKNTGRLMIFLSGAGRLGGAEAGTSFRLGITPQPALHEIQPVSGFETNVLSRAEMVRLSTSLGKKPSFYHSPARIHVEPSGNTKIHAVYAKDGKAALAQNKFRDWTAVYVAEAGGLTPEFFNRLVRENGGYAVTDSGLQADMNGDFMSLHGIIPGEYTIRLPFKADIMNLKNGRMIAEAAEQFILDVKPGTSYWFRLGKR